MRRPDVRYGVIRDPLLAADPHSKPAFTPKTDLISMRSTVKHFGIEADNALAIAEQVDV